MAEYPANSPWTGYGRLKSLKLGGIKDLRRLTIRPVFLTLSDLAFEFLPILTITSASLSEFVLELGRIRPSFYEICWGRWEISIGFFMNNLPGMKTSSSSSERATFMPWMLPGAMQVKGFLCWRVGDVFISKHPT